ncbi:enoyl-CoA hydratase [Saccharopolyspora rhizosphaerae]|uniref:Enoyl-CoA hydratase n=1 Tax=Saccharopolyspora rhizosphaerae TaxID=2492662 RepID=A0A426K334_9PSEU|nr:crotonase/enoyl-CoA hydratase family protein [Saccharopolyspora rhizosphaerae]RRO19875.1 enoyl-CoA hydratase [Saccharopolyspora rhizosphaerae]
MTYTEIDYSVSEQIATITLDRPEQLNAFTHVMRGELIAAFDEADSDDGVRAVIVTGAGRAFCAGADLSAGEDTFNGEANHVRAEAYSELGEVDGVPRDGGGTVALRIAAMRKPVIGAFNGAAVGVGVTMTLPMDIRLAAESAKFGFVFTRRGILPEAASSWFLPRVVGISQAMEWAATGRIFGSAEALSGRLVSRVVADDELIPTARSICREIAEHTSGVSVAVARQLMWGMFSADSPWEAHRLDSKGINVLGAGADAAEGVGSFLAKRAPEFPLRVSQDYPDFMPEWPARPEGV